MGSKDRDIEALLEQELNFHLKEAARCRRALAAYRGEDNSAQESARKPTTGWAPAIDDIFQKYEKLTIDELRDQLVLMGLPADDDQYLNTIRSTLSRKSGDQGPLERVAVGVYRRKLHGEVRETDDTQDESEGEDGDRDGVARVPRVRHKRSREI